MKSKQEGDKLTEEGNAIVEIDNHPEIYEKIKSHAFVGICDGKLITLNIIPDAELPVLGAPEISAIDIPLQKFRMRINGEIKEVELPDIPQNEPLLSHLKIHVLQIAYDIAKERVLIGERMYKRSQEEAMELNALLEMLVEEGKLTKEDLAEFEKKVKKLAEGS